MAAGGPKKRLWQCPECRHRFVTKNLWHSCGQYRLADHFTGKPPLLRATFNHFVRVARACGPVTVYAQKTRIVFQGRVRFAGAVVRATHLDASMWLKRRARHPRLARVEAFGRLGYGLHFRLERPTDIDSAFTTLLHEAYAIGQQASPSSRAGTQGVVSANSLRSPSDAISSGGVQSLSNPRRGERLMKAARSTSPGAADAERQLEAFIAKFSLKDQRLIRAVRKAVRKRLPTANELVWDNYNFFVIGYSPTVRPSDSILSIAARANGVGLCFLHGAGLPDPKKVLLGSGSQTRFIRLESADVLVRPEVEALVAAAMARAKTPLPDTGHGDLIIRSVSAKQRPRRTPAS